MAEQQKTKLGKIKKTHKKSVLLVKTMRHPNIQQIKQPENETAEAKQN